MKTQIVIVYMAAIALFIVTGCSNKSMEETHSGFLKSYEGLEADTKNTEGRRIQIMPDVDFTKYKNIYVAPVKILSGIVDGDQTPTQKKLFKEMSDYLTEGIRNDTKTNGAYVLVEDKNTPQTLLFESAISAVAVNFDDMEWYQFTPITMAATAAARASYVDKTVRILGEARVSDAKTGSVLMRVVNLQEGKDVSSKTGADELVFADVKPALDVWLKQYSKNLAKMRKGRLPN